MCERGGAGEFGTGFVEAAQFFEEVGADGGQEVVGLERRFGNEIVDEFEPGLRAESHGDGDGAIEFDDRRGRELGQGFVDGGDAGPVGF